MAGVENSFNKKEIKDNLNSLPNGAITAPFVNGNAEILRANTIILTTYTLQALDLSRIIRIPSSVVSNFDITIPQSFTGPSARRFVVINESNAVVRLVIDGTLTLNYATDPFVLTKNTLFDIYRVSSLNYVVVNSGGATPQVNDKENIVSGVVASGTNTYTATYVPTITEYEDGLKVLVRFPNANTSTATLNLNGLGAKAIVKGVSTALVSGDIPTGTTLLLAYDGTNFVIVGSQLVNQFFDWSPTYGGFSTPPSGGVNRYCLQDKLCNFYIAPTVNGTSNATTFTVTLPFNAKNIQVLAVSFTNDNGGAVTFGGYALTGVSSNVLSVSKASGAWTASGGKRAVISGWYEIE